MAYRIVSRPGFACVAVIVACVPAQPEPTRTPSPTLVLVEPSLPQPSPPQPPPPQSAPASNNDGHLFAVHSDGSLASVALLAVVENERATSPTRTDCDPIKGMQLDRLKHSQRSGVVQIDSVLDDEDNPCVGQFATTEDDSHLAATGLELMACSVHRASPEQLGIALSISRLRELAVDAGLGSLTTGGGGYSFFRAGDSRHRRWSHCWG